MSDETMQNKIKRPYLRLTPVEREMILSLRANGGVKSYGIQKGYRRELIGIAIAFFIGSFIGDLGYLWFTR
jgi:hypothetical protein